MYGKRRNSTLLLDSGRTISPRVRGIARVYNLLRGYVSQTRKYRPSRIVFYFSAILLIVKPIQYNIIVLLKIQSLSEDQTHTQARFRKFTNNDNDCVHTNHVIPST